MASRNWLRHSGRTIPKAAAIFSFDSTELRGRLAGVGYSSVAMETMFFTFSGWPNSPVSAGHEQQSSYSLTMASANSA